MKPFGGFFSILVVVFEPLPRGAWKLKERMFSQHGKNGFRFRKSWPSFRMFDAVAFLIAPYCYCWWFRYPVNSPVEVEVGSLSHYLHGLYRSQVVQDFFHQQYHPNESRICGSQNCLAVFFSVFKQVLQGLVNDLARRHGGWSGGGSGFSSAFLNSCHLLLGTRCWKNCNCTCFEVPIASMGLVCIPTFPFKINHSCR